MVSMSEEQVVSVSLKHMVNSNEIRCVLATPRKIPMDIRRDIAMRLISSLFGNESKVELPNDLLNAVNTVAGSDEWAQMKDASVKNDLLPKLILKTVLHSLLDSLDNGSDVYEGMRRSYDEISSFIRTMDIISSLSPISGFNYSVRDAHSELIDHAEAYDNLMERNDDLEWMSEIMRFMESELLNYERTGRRNNGRKLLIVIDTTKSMYGEPDMIAKSLALAITKQMVRIGKDAEVMFFPSDLPILRPTDGRDMVRLLSHRSASEASFTDALHMLMKKMKHGSIEDTDIILMSKGAGILNDPAFTLDWEAFKIKNGVKVITAVTGGNDACALTELSDHVMIFSDDTIHGKGTEFAKLIDVLSS